MSVFQLESSRPQEIRNWEKWRLCADGGPAYLARYLVKYSSRETNERFRARKLITPDDSWVGVCLQEIIDAIGNRLHLVSRVGGSELYQDVMAGRENGVDLQGLPIDVFLTQYVLPELLVVGEVGVMLDMPYELPESVLDQASIAPYLTVYTREDIYDYTFVRGARQRLSYLCLRTNPVSGDSLLGGNTELEGFRTFTAINGVVEVRDLEREASKAKRKTPGIPVTETASFTLDIDEIPFSILSLRESLMQHVATRQIALTNLESSDLGYMLSANFPMYVEQGGKYDNSHLKSASDGTAGSAVGQDSQAVVGDAIGRRYTGDVPPSFIAPSAEPMKVSMEKQATLKEDIRRHLHQQLVSSSTRQASTSFAFNDRPLEAGLSGIGLRLQTLENDIARIWTKFRASDNLPIVSYPRVWTLETDEVRFDKAEQLQKLRKTIPSKTFQQAVSAEIARTVLAGKISPSDILKIEEEIKAAPGVTADPDVITLLTENGILDNQAAAILAGLSPDAPAKAKIDHQERLARIAAATQTSNPATDPDPGFNAKRSRKAEKQSAVNPEGGKTATRGAAKNT